MAFLPHVLGELAKPVLYPRVVAQLVQHVGESAVGLKQFSDDRAHVRQLPHMLEQHEPEVDLPRDPDHRRRPQAQIQGLFVRHHPNNTAKTKNRISPSTTTTQERSAPPSSGVVNMLTEA